MTLKEWIDKIFSKDVFSGLLMISAMLSAIVLANSPWHAPIKHFWEMPLFIGIADFKFSHSLDWWINDVLMVFFFLQIGLELKREMKEGFLSKPTQILVPALAAIGGIICPAVIYVVLNNREPLYMNGWAIPTATDIAFAVCVLMLAGKAVPQTAKVFLLAIAIFDDLGAILIIALFYNQGVSLDLLGYAGLVCFALYILNKLQITWFLPYCTLGVFLWYCFLDGGVHTTMAGVVVAMAYPMRVNAKCYSPLERLSKMLKRLVDFMILPIFAFASSGLYLGNITVKTFTHPLTLGIILGLFLGKQIGIFGITWLLIKAKITNFPKEISLMDLYGIACVAGVGFTMALFIGKLSLPEIMQTEVRLGILCGSALSALWGAAVFQWKEHIKRKQPLRYL